MIGRSTLAVSCSVLLIACHVQVIEHEPGEAENTPCEGPNCPSAPQQPAPGSETPAASAPAPASTASAAAATTPPGCGALSEIDCGASEECAPITDIGGVYRGCGSRGAGCKEVETCASNGEVMALFPDSCVPDGYKTRPPSACAGVRR